MLQTIKIVFLLEKYKNVPYRALKLFSKTMKIEHPYLMPIVNKIKVVGWIG